jgi:hypothetical protein
MAEATPTSDRLADALQASGVPADMVTRARDGYYDDYKSTLAAPIVQLVVDLEALGRRNLADRARRGEWDGTAAEADAWAASPEGRAAFKDLLGGLGGDRS